MNLLLLVIFNHLLTIVCTFHINNKRLHTYRTLTLKLSNNVNNIVLFTPYCLRYHDNPCLNYIYNQSLRNNDSTLLYIHDDKLINCLGTYNGFSNDIIDDIITNFKEEIINNDSKLIQLHGDFKDTLVNYIDQLDYTLDNNVIICSSPLEPFKSLVNDVVSILNNKNINHIIVEDTLLSIENYKQINNNYDLNYNNYRNLYKDNRLIPVVNSIQENKSNINKLINDYLSLGDKKFSLLYSNQYINNIGSSSIEYSTSLHRLILDNNDDVNFFPGEVLSGLLSPYVSTGSISMRYLYWLKDKFGKYSFRNECIRRDWHKTIAKYYQNDLKSNSYTYFRYWKGYIQRECFTYNKLITKNQNPEYKIQNENHLLKSSSIVLVHGFGGSINQFDGLMNNLSDNLTSISIDSIGFGYSEKPPLSYNQYLWRDQIVNVIRYINNYLPNQITKTDNSDIILSGNSIGGYTAALASAYLNDSIYGLILFNSAGLLLNSSLPISNITTLTTKYNGPKNFLLQTIGKVIFYLLQPNIKKLCEWLYVSYPIVVTQNNLDKNIYRDSCDIGASDVIASGAKLPSPLSMNYILNSFNGPVLISQGALDPLNDATTRAYMFKQIRSNITTDLLQLGHCPMDESPELVASSIYKWLNKKL